jgi:hypothetical protein
VPEPTLGFGFGFRSAVGLRKLFEAARIMFSGVGPLGCLNGIGAESVLACGGFGLGLSGEGAVEVGDGPVGGAVERVDKKLRLLFLLGVGGTGVWVVDFRAGARGLSSSEPESHASSSAQLSLDCAAVMIEKWDEGRKPRCGLAGGAVMIEVVWLALGDAR